MLDAAIVWASEPGPGVIVPPLLQSWAAARGLRLVVPSDGGRHTIPVDMGVSKSIEDSLHQSRELMAQHDADGTERALAHAEGLVRAHPELPQAAWLLAEIERGWAARFAQLEPIDRPRAERHWRAAAALDGGRSPGIGEPSSPRDAPLPWHLDVVGHADDVLLDGHPVTSSETPGLHQLVAVASGQVVLAQWIAIAQGSNVRVVLPTPEACSRADFDTGTAACPSWVSVRRDGERFFVRSCTHATCGAELLVARMPQLPPRHEPRRHRGLPAWAAWTLGGAGVVAAGVIAGVVTWFAVPPVQQTHWMQQP